MNHLPKNLFLVGMPACGKSYFGNRLAQYLGRNFIDIDAAIEQEAQMSIAQIFESKGEAWFREQEASLIHKICNSLEKTVVATGGGLPCWGANRSVMQATGWMIYVETPLEILAERILKTEERPMFLNANKELVLLKLQQLWQKRASFYLQSQIILSYSTHQWDSLLEKLKL